MILVHADWLLLGDVAPLRDGAAVVDDANGVIVDVGEASSILAQHPNLPVTRIRGVVFPGLVNAHTHVELSSLRGKVAGGYGFSPWVDRLISIRVELTEEENVEAIDAACRELATAATVAVGDVSNTLSPVAPLARAGIGGCVFHEVLGMDRVAILKRIEGLRAEVEERVPSWPTKDLAYAPAPHTLFTLHADAVRALLDSASRRGIRTSLHLAEHVGERRAIEQGDGPVQEWYQTRLKQNPEWPKRPLFDFAEDVGALKANVVLVHLAEARREELDRVAKSEAPVVLCPRSNLYIENRLPPFLAVREAGIEAALGTDSLASNASLDVLAEAKALADRFPTVPAWELLKMATWNGARALGRPDLGRIAKGASPGLFAIDGEIAHDDPAKWILANLRQPRRSIVRRRNTQVMQEPS